jgi:deoxycytidylate deaminase
MSKRWTQAEQVMWAIYNCNNHFNKGRGLEVIDEDKVIKYNSNVVGHMIDDYENMEHMVIVLTLQSSMLPERVRKSLVEAANGNQFKVVFVPLMDIGFGLPEPKYISIKKAYSILKKVAKYSQDDIKTAALVGRGNHAFRPTTLSPIAYTCNQLLDGYADKFHAEQTLVEYVKSVELIEVERETWLMDLEPCEKCLKSIIHNGGGRNIRFVTPHKPKWNTAEYYECCDIIQIGASNLYGKKVNYKKEKLI